LRRRRFEAAAAQTLGGIMYSERASHYFKCGYNAVLYAHLDKLPMPSNPHHPGTFAHYDWSEGASACNAALRHAKRK